MDKRNYPLPKNYKKPSQVETAIGSVGFIAVSIFSLWAVIHLYNWYLPHPEVASSLRRLGGLLFLPLWFVIFLGLLIPYFMLVATVKKMMRLGPWAPEGGGEMSRSEAEEKKPAPPSTIPYWLMIAFFGGLFLAALFFIVQDMLIRHFPQEDWVIVLFVLLILGVPASIGALRIREIKRGGPARGSVPEPPRRTSPVVGMVVMGVMGSVLVFVGIFSAWRTHQFLGTALPAPGVVTRWVHHSGGRSGYDDLEVAFTTQKRVKLTLESPEHAGLEFLRPNVGQAVTVLYDPMEPADFRVDQISELWAGPIWGFLIAVVIFAGVFIGYRRRKTLGSKAEQG